jgi:integrase
MALTDIQVKTAKPKEKDYKLADGDGLYIQVTTRGGKWWRFRYQFEGKEKMLSFGTYPEISLADARNKRHEARKLVAHGIDPSAEKKALKDEQAVLRANSFETIGREWHAKEVKDGSWTDVHGATILNRMEKDVFPWIGKTPITEVSAKEIQAILDRVKARGVIETARRCYTIMRQVYTYAIMTGRAQYDISAGFRGYLPAISKTRVHMASVTDPKELAPLLRAIDGYQGGFVTQCALKLLPMLFVRPGELRHMEWSEVDFDAAQWSIPATKMKMRQPHLVPLCNRAVAILKELQPLTGSGKYVFPSTRSHARPISDNTFNAAYRRMGFDQDTITGHGFRATARTILDEVLHQPVDIIEHQLAHRVKDANGRAYNRTSHLPERRKMMQLWADYLDGLKVGAKVIPLKRSA